MCIMYMRCSGDVQLAAVWLSSFQVTHVNVYTTRKYIRNARTSVDRYSGSSPHKCTGLWLFTSLASHPAQRYPLFLTLPNGLFTAELAVSETAAGLALSEVELDFDLCAHRAAHLLARSLVSTSDTNNCVWLHFFRELVGPLDVDLRHAARP